MAQSAFSVFSVFPVLLASVLPLAIYPWDTYQGLGIDSWLPYGLIFAGLASVLVMVVHWFFPHLLAKKGFDIHKTELAVNRQKIRWSCICAGLLLITFFGWVLFMNLVPSTLFCDGTVFDNWDDFKAHMETPSEEYYYSSAESLDGTIYVKDCVYAKDGVTVLCEYYHRNFTVSTIEFGDSDTLLPVTVYSPNETSQGYQLRNVISSVFLIPAALAIILCIRQYHKKKSQIAETSGLD